MLIKHQVLYFLTTDEIKILKNDSSFLLL
jgi:hypothetical protein